MTTTTLRSGVTLVMCMTSGSPLPPGDDGVAGEGGQQGGQRNHNEESLASRIPDDGLEWPERVEGPNGIHDPAPAGRRSDGPVLGTNVDYGRPRIVKSHAVRGQRTPEICQVVAAPGENVHVHDARVGGRPNRSDASRESGVDGERPSASGVDEPRSTASSRDLVRENVAQADEANRPDVGRDAGPGQRESRLHR